MSYDGTMTLPLDRLLFLLGSPLIVYLNSLDLTVQICIGLGGLGRSTLKYAKAFGPKVTVISTAPDKEIAINLLKADVFI